jgi:hypothetical protein
VEIYFQVAANIYVMTLYVREGIMTRIKDREWIMTRIRNREWIVTRIRDREWIVTRIRDREWKRRGLGTENGKGED